ncbi:MAG: hypothetical protein GX066_07255 [Clostridiaceae bacterium]|nr:hypothetical protein [Clostridiaceae bacterium]
MKRISVLVLSLVVLLTSVFPAFTVQATGTGPESAQLLVYAATEPIYKDESYSYAERAADLVARMTLEEKASQAAGYNSSAIPRLGIASYMWWNEALHGYSQEGWFGFVTDGASYPSSYSIGASWDPDLYYEEALEIGREIRERVKGNKYNLTFFSPTVNLARDPRWGRNDESYGEDPFLTGKLAAAFVKGVEGKRKDGSYIVNNANNEGIKQAVTTLKHYTANNSEKNRYTSGADNVTLREMREYYTRPYNIVINDADVSSVMMAYSSVNGIPVSYSSYYMDTLLRQTFGFSGYIVSDCDSVATSYNRNIHNTNPHTGKRYTLGEAYANAMASGLDLQCNAGETDGLGSYASNYKKMLKDENGNSIVTDKGYFTEQQLEYSVFRLMTKRMQLGEFDKENPYVTEGAKRLANGIAGEYVNGVMGQTQKRIELADELSRATVVLLKNENKALPITADEINRSTGKYKVRIIGPVGQSNFRGGYSSWLTNEANLVTIEQAIKKAFNDPETYDQATRDKLDISYHYGFSSPVNRSSFTGLRSEDINLSDVEENVDLAIVVVGQGSGDSREDGDRTDLRLAQAQIDLIKQVKAKNPKKLILVMETYGPVNMVDDIVNNADAILWSSFNGFRKGTGFGESITGKNNPSGRTNATWLKDMVNDTPGFFDYSLYPSNGKGGRTYMYNVENVIYPFGYGLSYADVEYSPTKEGGSTLGAETPGSLVIGTSSNPITKDSVINVTFKITNTNNTAGKQVPQVYVVSPGAGTDPKIPLKRLVGFDKVFIPAGGSETVTIPVKVTDFAFFNEEKDCYELPTGEWKIWVARCSAFGEDDLCESFTVENGSIREDPKVVTVKPTQYGDGPSNGVSERVIFTLSDDPAKNVIYPNVAVTMANEKLYGTRVINNVPGKDIGVDPQRVKEVTEATDEKWTVPDTAAGVERLDAGKTAEQLPRIGTKYTLPDTYKVTYASNRPWVVQVGNETRPNVFADGQIVMKAPGVATITVKVTAPSGEEATTDFVVCVKNQPLITEITLGGNPIADFDPRTLEYNCIVPDGVDITSDTLAVKATAVPGATVEYSTTDDGSGTIGYKADTSGKGVKPTSIPGDVYIKISAEGVADQIYRVHFEEQISPTTFINGTIDDNWTIVNEDASQYEVVRGYGLKLPTLPDNISTSNTFKNLFLRPAAGDWTIVAKVYFPVRPTQATQQVKLFAWQDSANYISVGLQSGFSFFGPAGLTMSMAPIIGGASNGSISCSTGFSTSPDPLVIYYKLQREGLKFTAWFSTDGINYTRVQSADGRRASESSFLKDVQLGLFATKASTTSPTIDTYCEFIDVTSLNGQELKTDQEVLNDAFKNVVEYLKEEIPSEVYTDIKLLVPYDYTVTFDADAYINPNGTINPPEEDQMVNLKVKVSHPIAQIDGKNEVTVFDGKVKVKAAGSQTEYGVSKESLNIQKGQTESFYLTLGSMAARATIEVADEGIATVNTSSVTRDQGITVSAKAKGSTDIIVTWYDSSGAVLGSKTISVVVTDSTQQPSYDVSTKFNIDKLEANKLLVADVTVTNNMSESENVLVITALYDKNNRMINVSYLSKNIEVGATEKLSSGFKLPDVIDGHIARVFVWEGSSLSETNMVPISNVVSLQ